jgi:hypothetical protein
MKKNIIIIGLLFLATACSKEKKSTETVDSVKIVNSDSVATDKPKSEVLYLEDVLQCVDLQGLEKKYGKENVAKKATFETGEGSFECTKIFANTEKEVEIYWQDRKEYKQVQDVVAKGHVEKDGRILPISPWASRVGLHLGMKMSEVIAMNGKTFTITGIGWDLGGNVISWEGGKLAKKNVNIRFNDYSDNMGGLTEKEYESISGDREFDTKHTSIQKLNPVIDQLSVNAAFEISPELGQKLTKEVEEKQIKR